LLLPFFWQPAFLGDCLLFPALRSLTWRLPVFEVTCCDAEKGVLDSDPTDLMINLDIGHRTSIPKSENDQV
jgi:hypothetical protein